MIKYIKRFVSLGCLIMAFFGTSCTDDVTQEGSNRYEDGSAEFTLTIPDVEKYSQFGISTRDDVRVKPTPDEAHITNIYLVVVPANDADENTAFKVINLKGREREITTEYTKYYVSLYPGDYKFYVVANLDRYLTDQESSSTIINVVNSEADLNNIVLKFQEHQRIVSGILPMMCLPQEATKGGNNNNGVITVNAGQNDEILAPLKFLCSKVRYTILFDARQGGISQDFGRSRINFILDEENPATATKIATTSDLNQTKDLTSKIVNADFSYEGDDLNLRGWTNDDYDPKLRIEYGVGEIYSQSSYYIYQDIYNMPAGNYHLKLQGFFRYGSWEDSYNSHPNSENLVYKFHISDKNFNDAKKIPLKCLYDEDPSPRSDFWAYGYPFQMWEAEEVFNVDNKYWNECDYELKEDGLLRIGIFKDTFSGVKDDWTCIDNFRLYYTPFNVQTSLGDFNWNLELNRFEYNMGVNDVPNYPQSYDDSRLTPYTGEQNSWYDLDHKAWQGIIYLPENTTSDKTTLNFPYAYGAETQKPTENAVKSVPLFNDHGIDKGMFYDLVIRIKSIDQFGLNAVILESDINKWQAVPSENEW